MTGNVMYGATKGFLRIFSEALRVECVAMGVNVQLLCPGYTHTNFHDSASYDELDLRQLPGWMWASPEAVATASLHALARHKFLCVPGVCNQCISFVLRNRLVPKWLIRRVLI